MRMIIFMMGALALTVFGEDRPKEVDRPTHDKLKKGTCTAEGVDDYFECTRFGVKKGKWSWDNEKRPNKSIRKKVRK